MRKSFSELDKPALDESQKTKLAEKWKNVQERCVESDNCKGRFYFYALVKPLAFIRERM